VFYNHDISHRILSVTLSGFMTHFFNIIL